MYIHVGVIAKDSVAKARAVPRTQSDRSGDTAGRAGVFFSACSANLCSLPPTVLMWYGRDATPALTPNSLSTPPTFILCHLWEEGRGAPFTAVYKQAALKSMASYTWFWATQDWGRLKMASECFCLPAALPEVFSSVVPSQKLTIQA